MPTGFRRLAGAVETSPPSAVGDESSRSAARPSGLSLGVGDVMACLRLKLWDPELGRMVGYPEEARAVESRQRAS